MAKVNIAEQDTVQGRLNKFTDKNSDAMRYAAAYGRRQAGARGLTNSSISVGQSMEQVYKLGADVAKTEAQIAGQAAVESAANATEIRNIDATNQAAFDRTKLTTDTQLEIQRTGDIAAGERLASQIGSQEKIADLQSQTQKDIQTASDTAAYSRLEAQIGSTESIALAERANKMAISNAQIASAESISTARNTSNEGIAALQAQTSKDISASQITSAETIATAANVSREAVADAQITSAETIATAANASNTAISTAANTSREGIAAAANTSAESIADTQIQASKDIAAANNTTASAIATLQTTSAADIAAARNLSNETISANNAAAIAAENALNRLSTENVSKWNNEAAMELQGLREKFGVTSEYRSDATSAWTAFSNGIASIDMTASGASQTEQYNRLSAAFQSRMSYLNNARVNDLIAMELAGNATEADAMEAYNRASSLGMSAEDLDNIAGADSGTAAAWIQQRGLAMLTGVVNEDTTTTKKDTTKKDTVDGSGSTNDSTDQGGNSGSEGNDGTVRAGSTDGTTDGSITYTET